jgi:transcriptional antiterminator NusG
MMMNERVEEHAAMPERPGSVPPSVDDAGHAGGEEAPASFRPASSDPMPGTEGGGAADPASESARADAPPPAEPADEPAPAAIPVRAPRPAPRPRAAPAPAAPAPVAAPTTQQWFAVRVQSNKEESVKRNMERRIELRGLGKKILQVVVPTEKVAEIKNGKKRTRQVKTYPGYVLVEMFMDDETWAFVRETGGVGDFVGGGGNIHQKPFPLRSEEVNKIFGLEVPGQEEAKIKIDFAVGDKVKIREGPFENFDGVVEEINEQKGLVRVVVTIFGRATPVELKYWEVEAI